MKIFCGLEGGASSSKVVLLSESGHVLATGEGGATNHWLIGTEECFSRIAAMVRAALESAHVSDTCVEALGLCLSGCEDEANNQEMAQQFQSRFGGLAKHVFVASDTFGSLLTGSPDGGVVLIAGTGSNCLLFNPDGSASKCGGWGHILGDYGSAFWMANTAIKAVIESEDNFRKCAFDTCHVRRLVEEHFCVDHLSALLSPVYQHFDKSRFAALCRPLADLAAREDDPLARDIFRRAGVDLAEHVNAVLPNADPKLLTASGGLAVVCVGSVFKSWPLLESGFVSAISGHSEVTLRRLTTNSAFGAAFMAALKSGQRLAVDFADNWEVLCHVISGRVCA